MKLRTEDFCKEVATNPKTSNRANNRRVRYNTIKDRYEILSYDTVVAYKGIFSEYWSITGMKYSCTTSRHVNYLKRYLNYAPSQTF